VEVGHAQVIDPALGYFSGVTAIWPRRDAFEFRPFASGHVLHGAGEVTGLHQILEWGVIETPILLTSTLNVGKVHDAVVEYLTEKYPAMALTDDVAIPVVAECDDSRLSRSRERPVGAREVRQALDGASPGPVAQGSVGAGTGMVAFDFKGGIGTSSRRITVGIGANAREFTLGVLVNANVGVRRQLRANGRKIGQEMNAPLPSWERINPERSIIVVLATDAPLRPDQLRRLSVRAGMGVARAGSFASHGSGEFMISFTTTLGESRNPDAPLRQMQGLHDKFLSSFYEAAVECVEESILSSMLSAESFQGRDGNRVEALSLQESFAAWRPEGSPVS
jgi:D-aminopeptidase